MKKLLLTMTALLATAGAMAQGTAFDVPQNFTRLTADELNVVTGTKRIAIECTQVTNYNQLYNGTRDRTSISSTVLPENVVFEWIKVVDAETYKVKQVSTGKFMAKSNITTLVDETDAGNVQTFKALGVTGKIGDSHYSSDNTAENTYQVRLAISPNFTTWFNFNASVLGYNGGTGVWTVLHILDLSDYYKLTMTIVKGGETTTSVVYMKNGEDIVAPDYTAEGYATSYVTTQKTNNDDQTVTITYELDSQIQLQALVNHAKTYAGGPLIGEYSEASIAALAAAIKTAEDKLAAGTVAAGDVTTLQTAIDGLTRNMPEPGKFYQLATWKTENAGKVAFAKTDNKCYWGMNDTPAAVWVFEAAADGEYYLKNLSTGCYMNNYTSNAGGGADPNVLVESKQSVAVVASNNGRKVGVKVGNNYYLDRDQNNADANGCKPVCRWTDNAIPTGDNRMWLINEVESSDIKHTLSVGASGWATLVLGFNASIPTTEGVTVYAVESTTTTSATLKPVTGVLPANTAVLVKAPVNSTVEFAYTTGTASVRSLLEGTLYDKNITPEAGQTCYVLSMPADATEPGFYKAALNQESNTAFKNNANKVYLPVATENGAPSLSFVFDTETGIEGVGAAKAGKSAIHDLSGRHVKSAQKGIYIVNGKKVVK